MTETDLKRREDVNELLEKGMRMPKVIMLITKMLSVSNNPVPRFSSQKAEISPGNEV